MNNTILRFENISKQYRLGLVGTGTLSHDLNRWWYRIRGKEDPYLKIGEANDRATKGGSPYVWALQNINFEVNRGDVLGIIGQNGAGKSTLLKILSRVTSPTTGVIKSKGRIASLLEVGTGFHPELTGRENVYLNGAILGMTKSEIKAKLDEIVDFSGCERYLDTPVKRYSSGMKVRLAFAVAAHLDPEILVVDEVLAVGDAEFQKKAIGKMQDISKGGGRTVLFVSHNMAAVSNLCSRVISLRNGQIWAEGSTEIINDYLNSMTEIPQRDLRNRTDIRPNQKIWATELWFENETGKKITIARTGERLFINIRYKSRCESGKWPDVQLGFYDMIDQNIAACDTRISVNNADSKSSPSEGTIKCVIPKLPLRPGIYRLNLRLGQNGEWHEHIASVAQLQVEYGDFYGTGKLLSGNRSGVLMDYSWEFSTPADQLKEMVA